MNWLDRRTIIARGAGEVYALINYNGGEVTPAVRPYAKPLWDFAVDKFPLNIALCN